MNFLWIHVPLAPLRTPILHSGTRL